MNADTGWLRGANGLPLPACAHAAGGRIRRIGERGAVAGLRLPPFMVTLTSMMFFSGLAIWLTQSEDICNLPAAFNAMGGKTGRRFRVAVLAGGCGPPDAEPFAVGPLALCRRPQSRAARFPGCRWRRDGLGLRGRRRLLRPGRGALHWPGRERFAGAWPAVAAGRRRRHGHRRHEPVRRPRQGALDALRRAVPQAHRQQPEPARPVALHDHDGQGRRDPARGAAGRLRRWLGGPA